MAGFLIGVPTGIRTPVTSVKGRCPRPLDDRDSLSANERGRTLITAPREVKLDFRALEE